MNRLIINFKDVEATQENLLRSISVARKYAQKFPEAKRVSVSWNSPTELYAFTGRRHWDSVVFYDLVSVE